jgi:FkbM family methyltransferase
MWHSIHARRRVGDLVVAVLTYVASRPVVGRRIFQRILGGAQDQSFSTRTGDNLEILAFCQVQRDRSNAQLLQDLWVLYETKSKNKGFFVEFGAVDGIVHSNTLLLEREFGWSGILAEPNQDLENSLRANRVAEVDMRCVWSKSGVTVELLITEDPELSTVDEQASQDMHSIVRRGSNRRISVETISLGDLLDYHDAPAVVDYLSIDTEGTELELLSGFDWSRREIRLVSIEHNYRRDEADLDRLMKSNGYERRFAHLSAFDAWYRKRLRTD